MIGRERLLIAVSLSLLVTADGGFAQSQRILQENYDNLSLGSRISGWTAPQGGNTPTVQKISFNSAPHGAALSNDFEVLRSFSPLTGIVVIEIWMDPKVGSDTNNILRIALNNASGGNTVIGKNDSDRWFYSDGSTGQSVFFTPVDGEGHKIKIEYNTETARYNLFFDRDRDGDFDNQDFSVPNILLAPGVAGLPVTAITLNSGRGGGGTTSYFDDLVVSTFVSETDGLIANWRFEEGSGTQVRDSVGNHHGTISGAVFVRDPAPADGGQFALQFDGNNDKVSVPHSADLSFRANQQSFTVMAWVKTRDTNNGSIVEKKTFTGSGYGLHISGSGSADFEFEGEGETGTGVGGGFNVNNGEWHHIAGVHDATSRRIYLYIDGTLIGTQSTSSVSGVVGGTSNLEIASRPDFEPRSDLELNAIVDEVKIYNRVLNAEEIAAIGKYSQINKPNLTYYKPDGWDYPIVSTSRGALTSQTEEG